MKIGLPNWSVVCGSLAALIIVFAAAPSSTAIDLNTNGISDVWEMLYPGAANPTGDSNGDGRSNLAESIFGTNPMTPGGQFFTPDIAFNKVTNTLAISWPSVLGKRYQLQSRTDLASGTWGSDGTPVDGTGTTISVSRSLSGSGKTYRVEVSDKDTNGDGLTDWESLALGLDPTKLDSNGDGVSDYDFVASQVGAPHIVSIKATKPFASEDGPDAGIFTITRTRNLQPVTINYTVSGTATENTDYALDPPSHSVTLAQGVSSATITVNPASDGVVEGSESVTITLTAPAGNPAPYSVGTPSSATVIINDSTAPTGTGLLARYYDSSSTVYADAANFGQTGAAYTYTQNTSTTGTIVVTYTGASLGVVVGSVVKLSFISGNLNNALYNHQNYTVTTIGVNAFIVNITGASLPASSSGTCSISVQSFPHPAVITRVDPTVNFDWEYGTPNGVVISPNNSPDNYSATWDAYLQPTVPGDYTFQLDADDKAQVLLDTGSGLVQIVEHNWNSPGSDPVGTFKQSGLITLAVPGTPAARYHIQVQHVETTGDARCRLQWKVPGTTTFVNIPQANQFTHTQAMTYNYTRSGTSPNFTGSIVVTPTGGHSFTGGETVTLAFSTGNLFTPGAATSYNADYTITAVTGTTSYTVVAPPGASLPASGTGSGFVLNNTTSTTTGLYNLCYANTARTGSPGRVGVDAAVTTGNNGIWGSGTPDVALIQPDTFSVRWTGQVQPQFSEEYTFVVQADDGCVLKINGQPQVLSMSPTANTGGSTYLYDSTAGTLDINYTALIVSPGSFIVGETVRLDPSSGNLSHAPTTSPTYSYNSVTGLAVIDYTNLVVGHPGGTRTAGSYLVGDTVELDPTTGPVSLGQLPYQITAVAGNTFTVSFGAGAFATGTGNITISDNQNAVITALHAAGTGTYSYSSATGNAVVDYSALAGVPSGSFAIGGTVQLDPTSGNLSTLANALYTITATTATTFTVNVGTGFTTGTGNTTIVDTRTGVIPDSLTTAFTVNIGAGKYANGSIGNVSIDILNKPLKDWSSNANERYVRIPVIGGVRYDIQLDYYENTSAAKCLLSWYSPSQPKQIIPAQRLYPYPSPSTPPSTLAPASVISPTDQTALVGGAFSFEVEGSNGANVTVSGNPAWLTYSGGVLSGTPPPGAGGDYQIIITATSAAGTSTSVLNLHVDENAGNVVREYWDNVTGTGVGGIPPLDVNGKPFNPTGTANLTSLDATPDIVGNTGERIRGYVTAPVTGNYYFWIAASNAAELWISNDAESVNIFKRASVITGSTTPQTWNAEPNQKSPWLALEQGKKYYIEILHRTGAGSDNVAIGWLKPGETGTAPSQVVPGYVLSPYVAPAAGSTPGTLYVATMLAQAGAVTNGVGSSTLRLSEDENTAYMKRSYSGLTGPITAEHIHWDPYLDKNGGTQNNIMYDIDAPVTPGDGLITNPNDPNFGSYKWTILPVGLLTKADIIEIIKQGKAYINLHTASYPQGEIRGNYTLANGTRTFSPPPTPPAWTDDSNTSNGAARFLTQASFGGNASDIAALKALSATGGSATYPASRYETWINNQFAISATHHLPEVLAREIADAFGPFDVRLTIDTWWKNSISDPDQLRQRVACALSEIHVVSTQGPLQDNSRALSHFYDTLLDNAFGNFHDVLLGTTLTPGMGRYLDMLRNDKPDLSIGKSPNENYAREIKQLFSIGLFRMWPDGSLMLTSQDSPIDTYTQREIVGLAHVFTGWDYGYDGAFHTSFSAAVDWTRPMRETPGRHYTGTKRVLNNEVLPGLTTVNGGQPLDPDATHNVTYFNDAAYQALPAQELDATNDMLFNHPNVGPFICRQLIQRMVTSNPSRDYLYRVVQKFNDNGSGVRGDMQAVIKAILLDYEARSTNLIPVPAYGKQREPMLRVANATRALRPAAPTGTYSQTGTNTITITSTAHGLSQNQDVFLEFTDATSGGGQPAPSNGIYNVASVTTNTYTILAAGWITGAYNQPANSTVMTITLGGHWLPAGGQAWFDFTSGAASGLAGFDTTTHTVVNSTAVDFPGGSGNMSGTTFTIAGISPTSTSARSGNVMISRFSGSYSAGGTPRTITVDTAYGSSGGAGSYGTQADHGLLVNNSVFINFTTTRDTTSGNPTTTANDVVYTVNSVPDLNTFVVTALPAANSAIGNDNGIYIFPLKSQPLTRNGTVNRRLGTFNMDNTDLDIGQTPLSSPTVFNYFLPGYRYPGTLASQGITTPEFQITAETTVMRHANFIYDGVFNPDIVTGISSFKAGSDALLLDLSPWTGNAVNTAGSVGFILGDGVLGSGQQIAQRWTSNANLPILIDRLNTLLLAGQLPASAKTSIQKFLYQTISSIPVSNPCSITTPTAHGLVTGDSITISGVSGGTFRNTADTANVSINQTFTATVTSPTTFTLAISGGIRCTDTTGLTLTSAHFSPIAYNNSSPTTTNIRDRLRAVVHFILTSPDYIIQR